LVVDLPGADEHGIDISVEKHVLTIKAEPEDFQPEGFDRLHTEILPHRYERSFRLPEGIDVVRIDANVKNGVLRLTVPKSSEARPRQVAVKAG
jgi:HSP20 family molecular chaperone IbpA